MINRLIALLNNKLFSYAFTLVLMGAILLSSRSHWSEFADIRVISPGAIGWLSILFIATSLVNGYRLKIFAQAFGVTLPFTEWYGLECVRAFANYLPLSAGLAHNAAYLKAKNNLPVTKYVSLTAGSTILMLLSFGGWGVLLLGGGRLLTGNLNWAMMGLSAFFIAAAVAALAVPLPGLQSENRIMRQLTSVRDGWALIRADKRLLAKVLLLQTLILVFLSTRFYIIFKEIAAPLGFVGVVVLTIMTTLIRFTSLFPGNLGLREAIAGGVTRSFGLSFQSGFLAGVIDRLVAMAWIFTLGIIFSLVLATYRNEAAPPKL